MSSSRQWNPLHQFLTSDSLLRLCSSRCSSSLLITVARGGGTLTEACTVAEVALDTSSASSSFDTGADENLRHDDSDQDATREYNVPSALPSGRPSARRKGQELRSCEVTEESLSRPLFKSGFTALLQGRLILLLRATHGSAPTRDARGLAQRKSSNMDRGCLVPGTTRQKKWNCRHLPGCTSFRHLLLGMAGVQSLRGTLHFSSTQRCLATI